MYTSCKSMFYARGKEAKIKPSPLQATRPKYAQNENKTPRQVTLSSGGSERDKEEVFLLGQWQLYVGCAFMISTPYTHTHTLTLCWLPINRQYDFSHSYLIHGSVLSPLWAVGLLPEAAVATVLQSDLDLETLSPSQKTPKKKDGSSEKLQTQEKDDCH